MLNKTFRVQTGLFVLFGSLFASALFGAGKPVANFTFSPVSPAPGDTVFFTDTSSNSPTAWFWEFGDGKTSTQRNPTHVFSAQANFQVTLTASNQFGGDSRSKSIGVAATPTASFTYSPANPTPGQAVAFTDTSSNATSRQWDFGDGTTSTITFPSHVYAAVGIYSVKITVSNGSTSNSATQVVRVANSGSAPCSINSATLCVNGSRFEIRVAWRVPSQGSSGVGTAVSLASDTGAFFFFTPNNIEMVVKVVDGRAVNNRFWVFYGALSNVEYTLTIRDTLTGVTKTYFNASGTLASVSDTIGFSPTGLLPSEEDEVITPAESPAGFGDADPPAVTTSLESPSACTPGPTTQCLNNSRFQVQVAWRVPSQGTSGVGTGVPVASDTGAFWFFSANNLELVLKVVDGRAFNNHYWVFYGALTNVEYTITITDTATGAVKTYFNPNLNQASVADTAAF
jgi:PKD repeat protein